MTVTGYLLQVSLCPGHFIWFYLVPTITLQSKHRYSHFENVDTEALRLSILPKVSWHKWQSLDLKESLSESPSLWFFHAVLIPLPPG